MQTNSDRKMGFLSQTCRRMKDCVLPFSHTPANHVNLVPLCLVSILRVWESCKRPRSISVSWTLSPGSAGSNSGCSYSSVSPFPLGGERWSYERRRSLAKQPMEGTLAVPSSWMRWTGPMAFSALRLSLNLVGIPLHGRNFGGVFPTNGTYDYRE